MLARNSDLYFEVRASSVAFSSTARRACSIFLVLGLLPRHCVRASSALFVELLVGLLQFALLRLQFAGELLRLRQQPFGLHRRFDAVQDDANASRQLIEK